MLIKPYHGIWPVIHPTVFAGENVTVVGEVTLEENVSLWYGTIVRGDVAPITIRANTNLQDGCLVHDNASIPTIIGKNITVGHGAILHGCCVGDNCLIGMGAILLNGCVIGEGSVIAAGALVPERTVIPPGSVVMGNPGRIVRSVRPQETEYICVNAKHYVQLAQEQLVALDSTLHETKPG